MLRNPPEIASRVATHWLGSTALEQYQKIPILHSNP